MALYSVVAPKVTNKEYKKNWHVPVNNTKWNNQWTFTRKQVKNSSNCWQIWVLPRKLQAKMKSIYVFVCLSVLATLGKILLYININL